MSGTPTTDLRIFFTDWDVPGLPGGGPFGRRLPVVRLWGSGARRVMVSQGAPVL